MHKDKALLLALALAFGLALPVWAQGRGGHNRGGGGGGQQGGQQQAAPQAAAPAPAPTAPLPPVVGVLSRNWEEWDPTVVERLRDPQFHLAQAIATDSLTDDDVKKFLAEETKIALLQKQLGGEDKLTDDDRKQLHATLNETIAMIYGAKPDEASPKLNEVLAGRLDAADFAPDDAVELCAQLGRIWELKRLLGRKAGVDAELLVPAQREFNGLAANISEVAAKPQAAPQS